MKSCFNFGCAVACAVLCSFFSAGALFAQDKSAATPPFEVFVHPTKLSPKDKLTVGGPGKEIDIRHDSILLWIDLMPNARYGHPTEFILISAEGTRVEKGNWWPKLNGTDLFRDGKQFRVAFPLHVVGNLRNPKVVAAGHEEAKVHVHPNKLSPQDKLSADGKIIEIRSESFLVWVDLSPGARFAHPTEFVLISAAGTRVVKGDCWPTLNGKDLFRGSDAAASVSLPLFSATQPK